MITLTDSFKQHIENSISKKRINGNHPAVYLDVTSSGCSGLSYKFTYVFREQGTPTFIVSEKAQALLEGATIDYVTEGLQAGIKITNPNETSRCGCGESFNV